jgi:hypothetical protein
VEHRAAGIDQPLARPARALPHGQYAEWTAFP